MNANAYPYVSVLIPVYNEEQHIALCISQLFNQTYPKNKLELLVIDGRSTDKTREIVGEIQVYGKELCAKGSENEEGGEELHASNLRETPIRPVIRLLDNLKGQRASALNIGIREARGDVVLRIDARTRIPPEYICRCVETLIQTGADNVGGVVKPLNETPTQEAIGVAMSHPFGVGNAQFRVGRRSGLVDTVYPGCFRKGVFETVGSFDEDAPIISEDSDINQRIREAGGKVYLNTDIVVYYQPRESFTELWKLYFRYGGARAGNLLKHKKLTSWRQLVPPAFVLNIIALTVLTVVNHRFVVALMALLGLYVASDLLVAWYLAVTSKKTHLLGRLFIAFPCMHFAWALGFFRRLVERPKSGHYWSD